MHACMAFTSSSTNPLYASGNTLIPTLRWLQWLGKGQKTCQWL